MPVRAAKLVAGRRLLAIALVAMLTAGGCGGADAPTVPTLSVEEVGGIVFEDRDGDATASRGDAAVSVEG